MFRAPSGGEHETVFGRGERRTRMRFPRIVMPTLAILLVVGTVSALTVLRRPALAGTGGIDPADFNSPVANPSFPLHAGMALHYLRSEDREHFRERGAITRQT